MGARMTVLSGTFPALPEGGTAVTIGNFDGVHRGHRELLRRTVDYASEAGIPEVRVVREPFGPSPIPLGLSYVTFQVVSYLIDVYNEVCPSEKNFWNFIKKTLADTGNANATMSDPVTVTH